jgi:hypothetical protein
MSISAPAESPSGFPGVGQVRGGEAAAALADSTGRGPCAEYQLFFPFKKVFKWFAVAAKYSGAKFFFPCGAARR